MDHVEAFADPEGGTSLWCLAVHPTTSRPGVGEALTRTLLDRYQALGRRWLDLSVMHDNRPAIRLYEKLGFRRVPVYCIKRKNPINEPLFVPGAVDRLDELNPYARIIADEALRRGIEVEVLDPGWGELRLTSGAREHRDPRVALRAHDGGRDEPLRRQAGDASHPRRRRAASARAPWPPRAPNATPRPSTASATSW